MPIEVEVDGHGTMEFPDGTDPSVIQATVKRVVGGPAMASSHEPEKAKRTWTDTAVDAIPAVAGSVGGLLGMAGGPVGAAAGAVIGGAGGEGWRRTIQGLRGRRPEAAGESVGDTLKGVAKEGGIQGASEVAGGLVSKGLVKGGARLYRGLLKPSQGLRDGFGVDQMVRTLIDEGATISEPGLKKITERLSGSRETAMGMVKSASPGSPPVNPAEVIQEFRPVVETLRKRVATGQPSELRKVGERGQRLVQSMGRMDAVGAQTGKETAQHAASGAYKMMERGGVKQLSADDLLDEATARGFKKAVEKRVPGVAAQNQTTQRLMGGTRALEDAVDRPGASGGIGLRDLLSATAGTALGGPGGGVGAAALNRLLTNPRTGSGAAILMDRTGKHVPMDDLIRALTQALREDQ